MRSMSFERKAIVDWQSFDFDVQLQEKSKGGVRIFRCRFWFIFVRGRVFRDAMSNPARF